MQRVLPTPNDSSDAIYNQCYLQSALNSRPFSYRIRIVLLQPVLELA